MNKMHIYNLIAPTNSNSNNSLNNSLSQSTHLTSSLNNTESIVTANTHLNLSNTSFSDISRNSISNIIPLITTHVNNDNAYRTWKKMCKQ